MKKLLSVVLATLMLLSVFPLALPQSVTAETTPERIAYLDPTTGNATGELGDPEKPYKTFEDAYSALCPEGGTIVFVNPYEYIKDGAIITGLPAHYGTITVTAEGNYDNYWALIRYNTSVGAFGDYSVKFGGPVVIENIALVGAQGVGEYIYANFSPLTIGEGVKCYEAVMDGTTIASRQELGASTDKDAYPEKNWISLVGGAMNLDFSDSKKYSANLNISKRDTCITVNSGAWRTVVGGSRHSTTVDYTTSYNGNFRVYFNGGYTPFLFGGNWENGLVAGGQAYIYMTGGTVGALHIGHADINHALQRSSFLVWTGGEITSNTYDIVGRSDANLTVLYGGEIKLSSGKTANATITADTRLFETKSGDTVCIRIRNGAKVSYLPLCTYEGQVVYVDQTSGSACGTGADAEHAVNSYQTALAMFYLYGGTIKFVNNYTLSNKDTTSLYSFREPDHKPVVIDGQGNTFTNEASNADAVTSVKSISLTRKDPEDANKEVTTEHQITFSVPEGFDNYILSGDTTFQNIKFDFVNEANISANYHKIVMGTGISNGEKTVRVLGANYYPANRDVYVSSYAPYYADYSYADTDITIKSGTFWVSGFSRLLHANPAVPYASTQITVDDGTLTHLYTAPTNSNSASAENANVTINGGRVNFLVGGHAVGYGVNTGDVILTHNGGTLSEFNTDLFANCEDELVFIINKTYADYLGTKAALEATGATVTTEIEAPALINDSFGYKDFGNNTYYGVRATFATDSHLFIGEHADKYNIVELGVLVATEENAANITYIKGDYYYGVTEFGAKPNNYEGKVGKSVMYVKEASNEDESFDAYDWAGGDADIFFTAPVTEIDEANQITKFVFVPYMVMVDEAGNQQVFYGDATEAVSYVDVFEMAQ